MRWSPGILVSLIGLKMLRRREGCWQQRLDTFIPNGLNKRFVGIPIL